ncbi:hypothetical protein LCGC14_0392790 [marine sediment metagenome]|uniref:Uncharacterized protein n=1 Tax=marine sediment metagenome TaxID=412755 RepID=A0A0F9W7Z5_9ZZZZ
MPLPVDSISPSTSIEKVRHLISQTIQQLIDKEGKDPKAAAGQAFGMAEDKWGKTIPKTR